MSEARTILEALACGRRGCPCERPTSDGHGNTHCPSHNDPGPSLTITRGDKVPTLVHCHGGCDQRAVIAELRERGLWSAERREVSRIRYVAKRADGSPFATKTRIDYDDGTKSFTWPPGTKASAAPLWRIEDVAAADPGTIVYLVEGEKAADSLAERGILAVGSMCGSSLGPPDAEILPLARHRLRLWADADPSDFPIGQWHMAEIGRRLLALGCERVEWVTDPSAPEKGDGADCDDLSRLIVEPFDPTIHVEKPKPLRRTNTPTAAADQSAFPETDTDAALEFAKRNHDTLRHCFPLRTWFHFDGRRWANDTGGVAADTAQMYVRKLWVRALDVPGETDRKEASKRAQRLNTARGVRDLLELAAPHLAVEVGSFDRDPWLFNVANGTLDLRTGELRPHDKRDMLRKLSPVGYDAEAHDPRWDRFLKQTFQGDLDTIEFLQRWFGYGLTGDVREEKLVCHFGEEATGKSTLAEAVRAVLGDYGATANFATFVAKDIVSSGPTPELARLPGVRGLFSIEVDEGRRLAEGLVKMVTGGGEPIAAAFKYRDEFEYRPAFKLNLIANDAPQVRADDGAMWRRIRLVAYEHKLPEGQRDPTLKAAFRNDPALQSAVLRWCVEGSLQWQREGLAEPETVRTATASYREANDAFAEFFSDALKFDASADFFIINNDAWQAWRDWCAANGEHDTRTKDALGKALARKGAISDRARIDGKRHRIWRGVKWDTWDTFSPDSGKLPMRVRMEEVSGNGFEAVPRVPTGADDPRAITCSRCQRYQWQAGHGADGEPVCQECAAERAS